MGAMKSNFQPDTFTILNYQGSKKNLLSFIYENICGYLPDKKAFLDIFSGTCSVGYAMKRFLPVYTNDAEIYSTVIAKALILHNDPIDLQGLMPVILEKFQLNMERLHDCFGAYLMQEQSLVSRGESQSLAAFYAAYPVVWNPNVHYTIPGLAVSSLEEMREKRALLPYMLFTAYYANSYFGIRQSMEIDSLRYALEFVQDEGVRSILFSSLYFAMKECVFSKDGHMAQPLDKAKNTSKLLKTKQKDILASFLEKLKQFAAPEFVRVDHEKNHVFQADFNQLLHNPRIAQEVGFIYIDPPYTDMQYSRYYHLLNTVTLYDYPHISTRRGLVSKGIYREGRFQSELSHKSKAVGQLDKIYAFAKENNINVATSFAYPKDVLQKYDRYIADINDLVACTRSHFGAGNVIVKQEDYKHSNNRNTASKEVYEYLIIGTV